MKKRLSSILLFIIPFLASSQDDIYGVYRAKLRGENHEIVFSGDHKIISLASAGLNKSTIWEFGEWENSNDTIYVYLHRSISTKEISDISDTLVFIKWHGQLKRHLYNDIYQLYEKRVSKYIDGSIRSEVKRIENLTIITTYYENGKLDEYKEFKNGKKNGSYYKFNANGILIIKGKWRKDKAKGKWYYFDENGILKTIKKNNR